MGTRLRHLVNSDIVKLEAELESLPEEVNIKNIFYANGKWYCFFVLVGTQMRNPVTLKDEFKTKTKRRK